MYYWPASCVCILCTIDRHRVCVYYVLLTGIMCVCILCTIMVFHNWLRLRYNLSCRHVNILFDTFTCIFNNAIEHLKVLRYIWQKVSTCFEPTFLVHDDVSICLHYRGNFGDNVSFLKVQCLASTLVGWLQLASIALVCYIAVSPQTKNNFQK